MSAMIHRGGKCKFSLSGRLQQGSLEDDQVIFDYSWNKITPIPVSKQQENHYLDKYQELIGFRFNIEIELVDMYNVYSSQGLVTMNDKTRKLVSLLQSAEGKPYTGVIVTPDIDNSSDYYECYPDSDLSPETVSVLNKGSTLNLNFITVNIYSPSESLKILNRQE